MFRRNANLNSTASGAKRRKTSNQIYNGIRQFTGPLKIDEKFFFLY